MAPSNPPDFVRTALSSGIPPKLLTLAIIQQEGRLLLGYKKTGFGAGYYNGFGGKVEEGETIEQATLRELHEEAGITAEDLQQLGVLTFVFDDQPRPWEVHVYLATRYQGVPTESSEMRPVWFQPDQLPFDQMWADDMHWYPLFMRQQLFRGLFAFTNTTQLVWHVLKEAQSLQEVQQPAVQLLEFSESAPDNN